jgi:hypothetical protein
MLNCSTMRVAVILSAALLALGVGLGIIAAFTPLVIPSTQLALILVLAGAAVLSVVFVDALLPGAGRRLDGCQH